MAGEAEKTGPAAVPCGLLNLNKPAGLTSRRAVDLVQRLGRRLKADTPARSTPWRPACWSSVSAPPPG
jgi:hypothetical protein